MRHAGGTVVGVHVLASTGTARARSHTPRGSPLAHSILIELYILYHRILVEGGRDISELRCLTRCRWCAPARCRQRLATRLLLASRLLGMSCFGSSLTARPLPAWSPFPLFLSSPLSAATGPMPVVSGVPSPRGFGAAVIAAPGKTQTRQQQIWGKLDAEEFFFAGL